MAEALLLGGNAAGDHLIKLLSHTGDRSNHYNGISTHDMEITCLRLGILE
jgi:hypothetical protein